MIPYLVAEWREWSKDRMPRTIAGGIAVMAFVGAVSSAHPYALSLALLFQSIWLGWYLGNRYWRGTLSRSKFLYAKLSPGRAVAGKIVASIAIAAVHAIASTPILLLMAVLWGVSAAGLFLCLSICFASFFVSLALGFVSSLALPSVEGFFGTLALALWLILTAAIGPARTANPLIQTWLCMNKSGSASVALCAPILFACACALLALSVPLIRRLRMDSHE